MYVFLPLNSCQTVRISNLFIYIFGMNIAIRMRPLLDTGQMLPRIFLICTFTLDSIEHQMKSENEYLYILVNRHHFMDA